METFEPNELRHKAYRTIFLQKGGSVGINRFMNTMNGEGLGNYFGTSMRKTIPLTTNSIKGVKPKKKSNTVKSGTKRKAHIGKKSKAIVVHTPHKKVKSQWRNL